MKVRCPFCPMKPQYQHTREYSSTHMLDAHLQDHSPMTIRNYYVVLLFKIHEKIDELEKKNLGHGHLRNCITEIKSLLDNEK